MKKQIKNYQFNPVTREVTFDDITTLRKDSIINIVNVTENIAIYNYINRDLDGSVSGNKLTLSYDTSTMASDDDLYIIYDDESGGATEAKQDEIIQALTGGASKFYFRGKKIDDNYKYISKEDIASGKWEIMRLDKEDKSIVHYAFGDADFQDNWTNFDNLTYN